MKYRLPSPPAFLALGCPQLNITMNDLQPDEGYASIPVFPFPCFQFANITYHYFSNMIFQLLYLLMRYSYRLFERSPGLHHSRPVFVLAGAGTRARS